jgi:hypothetical protein
MAQRSHGSGPDPRRVRNLAELTRELDLLRARAAAGTMKAKVSLEDLAGLVRLPRSTLHSYVSGQTLVPSEVLDRMVLALGADPAEQREWNEAWYRVYAGVHGDSRVAGAEPAEGPFCLPQVARGFTGRVAELAELDGLLDPGGGDGTGPVIAAITGAPGVGKTALALWWAHHAREHFPDGCLYVDLRGHDPDPPLRAAGALAALLGSLVRDEPIPTDVAVLAARYRSRLDGRRVLVLLDNALCAEQVRPLLPGAGASMVVITSRDDLAGLVTRDGAHRLDLGVLPLPDALALLATVLDTDLGSAARQAAMVLAQRCDRLPLAMRIAGPTLASESDGEFLARLSAGGDPRTNLRTVFSWSYRRLAHDNPDAARMFRLLGSLRSADFTVATVAALSGSGPDESGRLVDDLRRAHLVESPRPGRFRLRRLLHAYARELAAAVPAQRNGGGMRANPHPTAFP